MKKIRKLLSITVLGFLFTFAKAEVNMPNAFADLQKNSIFNTTSKKLNSINSYQSYLKFKKDIEKLVVFEPAQGYFILGSLYLKEFHFKNKTIYRNFDKALAYFYQSLKNGNKLAAYFIGLIEYRKGNVYKALYILQNTLNSLQKAPDNVTYSLLAKEYASIVLDKLRNDKNALQKAIFYLQKVNSNDKAAAYLLANLYYFKGPKYINLANRILSYACNTKNPQLHKICEENPYIKGNEINIRCPILRKQEK